MSSHHFVKEKQEPALIIENLEGFDNEHFGQLLEWNPVILCPEQSYHQLINAKINVDILFSCEAVPETSQSGLRKKNYQGSFLSTAITYLIHQQYHAVNIIAHDINLQTLLPYASSINLIVYQEKMRSFAVRSGFRKWKPLDSIVIIQDVPNLRVQGLKKVVDSSYRTLQDGFYRVEFDQHYAFITEVI